MPGRRLRSSAGRPTRAGVGLLIVAVGCFVAGRLLGLVEFYVLGAVAVTALLVSLVLLRAWALEVVVTRSVEPARVPAGDEARVELRLTNRARRATPTLRLRDAVSGTRGARLLVPPVAPGATSAAAYRLPTERRGVVTVGPLAVEALDPLGLVRSQIATAPSTELLVHPALHRLPSLPDTDGADPLAGSDLAAPMSVSGDEFHALRPYVNGDDIRRIHWPSSARHDHLLVRQDERPRQGRLVVLLDVRGPEATDAALDLATSVAASVIDTAHRHRQLTRLVATNGLDTGFGSGGVHADLVLRALSVIGPGTPAALHETLDAALIDAGRAAVAVVALHLTHEDERAVELARRRAGALTLVEIDRSAWDADAPEPAGASAHLVITRSRPFPATWPRRTRAGSRTAATA